MFPVDALHSPDVDIDEDGKLFLAFLERFGHTRGIVDGYNNAIKNIIALVDKKSKEFPFNEFTFTFDNGRVSRPELLPIEIFETGKGSYVLQLFTDLIIRHTKLPERIVRDINFGYIPLMIGSYYDPLSRKRPEPDAFSPAEIAGEDPAEPDSIFIINGKHMVANMNDTLIVNTIINYTTSTKGDFSTLVSQITTESRQGKTALYRINLKKGVLHYDSFREFSKDDKSLDVLDTFHLLGYDEEEQGPLEDFITSFTRPEWRDKIRMELSFSLADYREKTRVQLISFLSELTSEPKSLGFSHFQNKLRKELYSHIGTDAKYDKTKQALLALHIVQLLESHLRLRPLNDRNSYSNKRFKNIGGAMFHLFGIFLESRMASFSGDYNPAHTDDAIRANFDNDTITDHYVQSFEKSWGLKSKTGAKKNVFVEKLKNEQFMLQMAHVDKVVRNRDAHSKDYRIRKVHGAQTRYVCPAETPESNKCGLNNTKASLEYNSQHHDDREIIVTLREMAKNGDVDIIFDDYQRDMLYDSFLIINGIIHGVCSGKGVYDVLLSMRRRNVVPFDIQIIYEEKDGRVSVNTDGGRPVAPCLVVENNKILLEEMGLEKETDIERLITSGAIDFVGPRELEWKVLAFSREEFHNRQRAVREYANRLEYLRSIRKRVMDGEILFQSIHDPTVFVNAELREKQFTEERDRMMVLWNVENEKYERYMNLLEDLVNQNDDIGFEDKFNELVGHIERTRATMSRYDPNKIESLHSDKEGLTPTLLDGIIARVEDQYHLAQYKSRFDYCDIDPVSLMGITLSILPFASHNPGPRQTFACKMAKQAMSLPTFSMRWNPRSSKYLVYPQRSCTETQTYNYLRLNTHCIGFTPIIAVFIGQDTVEDMVKISRGFIQRGGAQSVTAKVIRNKTTKLGRDIRGDKSVVTIRITNELPKKIVGSNQHLYRHLGTDGIVIPGSVVVEGDCLIGKYKEIRSGDSIKYYDMSLYVKRSKQGIIESVVVSDKTEKEVSIRIQIDELRTPEEGDKFSNGHAQKTTAGIIVDEADMPYSAVTGCPADIVMNSHAHPSRMTIGMLLEMIFGKAHVLNDKRYNSTSLRSTNEKEEVMEVLKANDFDPFGKEPYINPDTGKEYTAHVFTGLAYYYRLVHEAAPKLQNRDVGAYKIESHQPVTGIDNGGGMRYGEMEFEVLMTHGISNTITEYGTRNSDYFLVYTCAICNSRIYRGRGDVFRCDRCRKIVEKDNILFAESTYVQEVLRKHMEAMGTASTYYLTPIGEEALLRQ